jgi:hypothetical protein
MGILSIFKKEKKPSAPFVPFGVVESVNGDYDEFYKKLLSRSLIMLITGKRGSGKTGLGMKLLEAFNEESNRKCYAIGFGGSKLPGWIKNVEDIQKVPNDAVCLVDEGAITFGSRDSMKAANKELSSLMAVARHKGLSLILITQSSSMLEVNVLRLADVVLLKEPSLLQAKFERKAVKDMYEQIGEKFKARTNRERYFYIWSDEFEGLAEFELPPFWNESISKSFKNSKK